jgi:biopolymer transport protein ExbB
VGELIVKGGPVMYALLGLSVLALAIVLFKAIELGRLRLRPTEFVEETLSLLTRGEWRAASALLVRQHHPVARVMSASLAVSLDASLDGETARAEVARAGSKEVRGLESWLRGLSAIGHLSPLLGLLGTVLGMIEAFMTVERAGASVSPATLAGGIWEALLTTAFGLTVALPAMAAFYVFEGEVDRIRAEMKDASVRVLVRFGKAPDVATRAATLLVEQEQDYGV